MFTKKNLKVTCQYEQKKKVEVSSQLMIAKLITP